MAQSVTGKDIYQTRTSLNQSRMNAAREMGISSKYVQMLETEKADREMPPYAVSWYYNKIKEIASRA